MPHRRAHRRITLICPMNYHGCMSNVQDENGRGTREAADRIISRLGAIDEKVNDMRNQRINDPDSLGDKIIKAALPSLAGLVAGKLFHTLWSTGASRAGRGRTAGNATEPGISKATAAESRSDAEQNQGVIAGLAFAALSAAFAAVVSQLSDRGSQAFVNRRHRKRAAKR